MSLAQSIRTLVKARKHDELDDLISTSSTPDLIEALTTSLQHSGDGFATWNAILSGFGGGGGTGDHQPRLDDLFRLTVATLDHLNRVEVPQKQCYDLIIRLHSELGRFRAAQLIELCEFCVDSLRLGDPKCLAWKDLLPELIKLLLQQSELCVNAIPMSGAEYRAQCVRQICTMRWPSTILPAITMMFIEMPISAAEQSQVLHKISAQLDGLQPTELPPLAYQLFRMCQTPALVLIPIHALSRYFQKHYYARLFAELDSDATDVDSIEQYSAREMQEAQETILYHLGKATEFRVAERELVQCLRPMAATPRFMLQPFFLSALLSMCQINRYPETALLSSSLVMPFLRSLIAGSETEERMCERSAWARATRVRVGTQLGRVLDVLVEQSRDGKEVVTPGIVWLAFALLRAGRGGVAATAMHQLAVGFLERFVKRRFIFGAGVVKNVVEMVLADLEATQFGDCLTRLSLSSTYTVSECLGTLQRLLDYLLLIPGTHAMRLMSCIIPLCKSSQKIRDLFIETLRKAMYQRDSGTRQMGVYGFCLVLKHLRENNARRAATNAASGSAAHMLSGGGNSTALRQRLSAVFTQQSISGYSLMSQSMLLAGDGADNPQRHFDMLALEIVGVLRKCFNQTYEVKAVLYEGLHRAIDFNPKLTAHIVQFLEWPFHRYFEADPAQSTNDDETDRAAGGPLVFRLDAVLRDLDGAISVWDHLGHLIQLMAHCVHVARRRGAERDTRAVAARLDTLVERIGELDNEQTVGLLAGGVMDVKCMHLGEQMLNCLEALMGYVLWQQLSAAEPSTVAAEAVLRLFRQHCEVREMMRTANVLRKSAGKRDKNASSVGTTQPAESESMSAEKTAKRATLVFQPHNIWDLATLERFLSAVFVDDVHFASAAALAPLRSAPELAGYVLSVAVEQMLALPAVAEARHSKHSQSTFAQLGQIGRVLWAHGCQRLALVLERHGKMAGQLVCAAWLQCLRVAEQLYARKLVYFLQAITLEPTTSNLARNCSILLTELQLTIDKCLRDEIETGEQSKELHIEQTLLGCVELLLEHLPADDQCATESYTWLYNTCLNNAVHRRQMHAIHRLLFRQRVRTNTGQFFDSVARQCQLLLCDEPVSAPPAFHLKSLDAETVDSCLPHLCATLRDQIADCEYFITKSRSLLARLRIVGQSSAAAEQCIRDMRTTEQRCSGQLVQIAQAIAPLATVGLPAGQLTDAVIRVLLDFYVCWANFTRHLLLRQPTVAVNCQLVRFDRLVRVAGKPLSSRVYDLIEHIENSVFADERYSKSGAADRAKVLRATRQLPRLVLRVENVNRFVMVLGKKTGAELAQWLHMGTVRDFKIKKGALRDVLAGEVEDGAGAEEAGDSDDGENEVDDGLCDDIDEHSETTASTSPTSLSTDSVGLNVSDGQLLPSSSITSTGRIRENAQADCTRPEAALKNLAIMNARLKRKRAASVVDDEQGEVGRGGKQAAAAAAATAAEKKKRAKRVPLVINKTKLQENTARRSTRKPSKLD